MPFLILQNISLGWANISLISDMFRNQIFPERVVLNAGKVERMSLHGYSYASFWSMLLHFL